VVFSLALSAVLGSIVSVGFVAANKRNWSSRIPYGPYIAAAAVIWIFGGYKWFRHLFL
jgi:leader peptidase (prepilin peptidase)/N-methyltransferase